jgi:hypothetical protein
MATRMYFSRDAFTYINPGTLGTWGSSVKSIKQLLNSGSTDASLLNTGYTGYGLGTVLYRQYISPPMSASISFTGSTTTTLVNRHSESSTSANAYQLYYVAIVNSSGVVQASFSANEKDGTEFATSLTARSNLNTGGLGTYTTTAGDRIVVELGWDQDASGSYTITMSEGYVGGTDLSGEGDTDIQQGWIEFSNTITFTAEGAPPATNEDWDVTAYITGVLDEWI